MKMRGALAFVSLLALTSFLISPALSQQSGAASRKHTRPPKNLKKMPDGHWTPWDPPTPPPGARVHVVVKGDTLWDLSAQYLNNPYLWPQIWDQNRYILDSHWIYPGDPVILPTLEVVPEKPTAERVVEEEEEVAPPVPKPPVHYALGDRKDLHCAAYIQDSPPRGMARVVASEEERLIGLGQGHVVYLDAGTRDGLKPGDRLTILRDRGKVTHPVSRKALGYRIDPMGEVSLLAVQERASTAEITYACEDVRKGDFVVALRELSAPVSETPPETRIDRYDSDSSGKTAGYLVMSTDPQEALGQGNVVAVDIGAADGLKPGDYLSIYRANPSGEDLPRVNLGKGVVLLTEPKTSVVRITASVREIYLGDRVEMR